MIIGEVNRKDYTIASFHADHKSFCVTANTHRGKFRFKEGVELV